MSLKNGSTLGPYEIESPLGEGGMGEVYRAKDTRLGRSVAIKILPANLAKSDDARLRLEREAKAISSLNHPNICALYDIGHDEGTDYLVMELIEGESLADRLDKGALPLKDLLPIAIQVADALENAHRNGLVHRDLKPGNVMLTKSGAKLLDFGLAKLLPQQGVVDGVTSGPEANLTVEGSIIGTMQYMPPEQLEGREVDARSDIFAFGAMLYEMATGKRAFDGSSQASLIASILMDQPAPVTELQPLSPLALERTIMQCLEKNPDDRWQTAGDLKRELKWLTSDATRSPVATTPAAPQTSGRRVNRWLAAALGVALLSLLATVGFQIFASPKSEQVFRKYAVTVEDLQAGFSDHPTVSPNGRLIVYRAKNRLWLQDLSKLKPEPLTNTERTGLESASGMFWSPDSKWIAYGEDYRIWKQAVGSSDRTQICRIPESQRIIGGGWAPSGRIVLAVWRGGLYETRESGGGPTLLVAADSLLYHDFHAPSFLPDGKTVVFWVHARDNERDGFGILREGDSSITMDTTIPLKGEPCYSNSGHLLYAVEESGRTIWAVPYSAETLKLTGNPFPLGIPGQFPTVSDDGMLVCTSNSPQPSIQPVRISLDGRESQPMGPPVVGWTAPRFSPDGKTLFYTSYDEGDWNLWKMDIERGAQTRLTSDEAIESNPQWLPSRGGYLINRFRDVSNGSLDVLDLSTGRADSVMGNGYNHSVSADGRYITYTADVNGDLDIRYVDAEDATMTPHTLLSTPDFETDAAIAPNGQWFAYTGTSDDVEQIFLRRFPDARDPVQVSIDGGRHPFWNPSGSTLYFNTDSALISVAVTWGGIPRLGTPRTIRGSENNKLRLETDVWYSIGNVAISPDGTYFVAGERLGGTTNRQIYIIENWFEDFKQREASK